MVGDADPVPLTRRPEFTALGTGSLADRIGAAARLLTATIQRTWGLNLALNEAGTERERAVKLREVEHRRWDSVREGAEMMTDQPVDDDVVDGLCVVTGADAFHSLTHIGSRTVELYEQWLATTIHRLLDHDQTRDQIPALPPRKP